MFAHLLIMEKEIKSFFAAYEQRFNDALSGDASGIGDTVNSFAKYFVESSPAGVQGGANDESFKERLPKGYEFYRSIGTKSMRIGNLEITRLDPLHHMVKVHWISVYEKKDTIEFDVIYFLNGLKIFAYITGDEQKVLQEHGLVPQQ